MGRYYARKGGMPFVLYRKLSATDWVATVKSMYSARRIARLLNADEARKAKKQRRKNA